MKKLFIAYSVSISSVMLFFLGLFIYQIYFKSALQAKHVVDEISNMKIDTCINDTLNKHVYYTFYVGSKYKIIINRQLPWPYKSEGEDDLTIMDVTGKSVMLYNSKYNYSWNARKNDYERLLKYLKIKKI